MDPESIFENIQTAILVLDDQLRVTRVNQAFEASFGASARRICGAKISTVFGDDSELVKSFRQALDQQQPLIQHHIDLPLVGNNSARMHCLITPVIESQKTNLLAEFHPSYTREPMFQEEDVFARQQANQLMLRGLAHEIKNPLGGLRGAAQLLSDGPSEEERKEFTQIVIDEVDRLTALVNRMLSPSVTLKRKTTNIHEIIERVLALTVQNLPATVQLERDYDPSIPLLFSDEGQLIQIILNLVRNAVQAISEGEVREGKIVIRTRITGRLTIGLKKHRQLAQIEIFDNGPGIPEDFQKQVFLPLVSGRAEGSGLGLSIAQSLITPLGGLIKFTSNPGNTVFTVLLPIENDE